MKQTFLSRRFHGAAATAALSLSLVFLAGCSDGEGSPSTEENVTTVANFGFTNAERLALRKAGKGRKEMEKAIINKKLEELKARGIEIEIVPPGKKTKNRR